jgi:hypothetical protein
MHNPIDAFRETADHLIAIPGILNVLEISLARADELPGLIARSSCPLERGRLKEEQAALGNPAAMRARKARFEHELRLGLLGIRQMLHAAIDAAKEAVTTTAGGAAAVQKLPFASRHLSMLARYREPLPPTESIRLRLGLLEGSRFVIDAAVDSLDEIRFEERAARGALLKK